MAIKFTPEYNKRINKVVKDYNKKVTRAHAEGKIKKQDLPGLVSVKTLKKSYVRRSDLNRELESLEAFSRKGARKQVTEHVSEYDLKIININRDKAIEFYETQRRIISNKLKNNYPLQKGRLKAVEANLNLLKSDYNNMDDKQLWAVKGSVEDFRQSFERQATGYRGFLSEVDMVMRNLDFSKEDRDELFKKLSKLNQEELYDLYESNPLINRIYMLADSPKLKGGELVLNTTEKQARKDIETLMEEIDDLIVEVKQRNKV